MPLQDHFQSPLKDDCTWESFHSAWANAMVGRLNQEWLPDNYRAIPQVHYSSPAENYFSGDHDIYEVQIREPDRRRLVAAVELVSPGNKDRPSSRRDFAIKCAGYLQHRVALIIVDVITERRQNLHKELVELLELPAALEEAASVPLYAVAYRLHQKEDRQDLELWPEALTVGTPMPTLPLWINEELAVPLELEATYLGACEALRI